MSTKTYRGPKNLTRIDGSEPINGWVRRIAETQTYPAVRRRNNLSLDADPVDLWFYQALTSGRRCTCWGKDASPHSNCPNCFSRGIVGGFNKFGTAQVIIDAGLPEVRANGVVRETNTEGPEVLVLDDNTISGEFTVRTSFDGHWGPVDHISTLVYKPDGGAVRWSVRSLDGPWVPLNTQNLDHLFDRPQLLELRCELERPGLEARSPVVVNAHIRIKRHPDVELVVRADRPKITRALALAELGVMDEWTTAIHWLDHTLSKITSNDWFYNIKDSIRWKVVDATDLSPQGYLLSWDATCRRVQDFEPMAKYPV